MVDYCFVGLRWDYIIKSDRIVLDRKQKRRLANILLVVVVEVVEPRARRESSVDPTLRSNCHDEGVRCVMALLAKSRRPVIVIGSSEYVTKFNFLFGQFPSVNVSEKLAYNLLRVG